MSSLLDFSESRLSQATDNEILEEILELPLSDFWQYPIGAYRAGIWFLEQHATNLPADLRDEINAWVHNPQGYGPTIHRYLGVAARRIPIQAASDQIRENKQILFKLSQYLFCHQREIFSAVPHIPQTITEAIWLYREFAFAARLKFLNAQYFGWSSGDLNGFMIAMSESRGRATTSAEAVLVLHYYRCVALEEIERLRQEFNDPVNLEPVGGAVALSSFSEPLDAIQDPESLCVICQETVNPETGIVLHACRHVFCASCLLPWTGQYTSASHTCPCCRTAMFPEPVYQPRADSPNYEALMENQRALIKELELLIRSLVVLNVEIQDWASLVGWAETPSTLDPGAAGRYLEHLDDEEEVSSGVFWVTGWGETCRLADHYWPILMELPRPWPEAWVPE